MKVLHIAPTPFFADRGCHIRILGEVSSLKKQGIEVLITTYHLGRDVENLNIHRTIKIPWYNKLSAGGSWHKLYLDFFLLILSIKDTIKYKPNILHGHLHEGALIAKVTSWLVSFGKIPVIFDSQGSLTGELNTYGMLKKEGFQHKVFKTIERFICRLPNHIVCSSQSNRNFILKEMKIKEDRVSELIDGLYLPSANFNHEEFKTQLGLKNEKVVIYSGSLLPSKGIDYFINAIPAVNKDYNDVKFLIIGYPIDNIKKKISELNIDQSVILVGKVDFFELFKYLEISDIAIDPKMDNAGEGSGKLINYMGAGLPVICFDTLNNRNFLGDNGIYVNSGSTADLAIKIIQYLKNHSSQEELGLRNRERVLEKFSWDTKILDLLQIYKLLNKS